MVEESLGGDVGVDAEFLREVAEGFSDFVFLFEDVEIAERDRSGVGLLQRSDRPHEGGLAGPVRAEESVHAGRDRQADVLEGLDAVSVGLGDVADFELHGAAGRGVAGGGTALRKSPTAIPCWKFSTL